MAPGDGSIHRVGLDYSGVRVGLDLAGIEMTRELWADLQMIEAGALTPEVEA